MTAINAKIETLDVKMLREMAEKLSNDFQEGADIVLNAVMLRLEVLMSEDEFVVFCDTL